MAPHSSTLAWKNPMDGGAWQAAVHGVSRSRTRLSDFTFTFHFQYWRRKWQPTPVFLPGESQGRGSLVGCRLWGCTESDTTEATQQQQQQQNYQRTHKLINIYLVHILSLALKTWVKCQLLPDNYTYILINQKYCKGFCILSSLTLFRVEGREHVLYF